MARDLGYLLHEWLQVTFHAVSYDRGIAHNDAPDLLSICAQTPEPIGNLEIKANEHCFSNEEDVHTHTERERERERETYRLDVHVSI